MFRQLLYPILPYRSFIFPILVLVAVVIPCWLAFRLHHRRISGERPSVPRELLLLAFAVYLAGLGAVTLAPSQGSRLYDVGQAGIELRPSLTSLTCSRAIVGRDATVPTFCARNAKGNVALFFPLGVLLPLVWSRLRFGRGMAIAIALSTGIELTQYVSRAWGSFRSPDVNDLILNAVGAALGLALVALLRFRGRFRPEAVAV